MKRDGLWPLALMLTMGLLLWGCPGNDDDDDAADDDDATAGDDDDATADDDDDATPGDDDDATPGDDDDDDTVGDDDDTEVPMTIPAPSGVTCEDEEPNDCSLDEETDTWEGCRQECVGMLTADGLSDQITGTLETIVLETWDGDNDTFFFVLQGDGYVNGVLDWVYPKNGDLDWYLMCYFEDKYNPAAWYVMMDTTVDLTQPEQGTSVVAMTTGTLCYAWVVGYLADDGEPYVLDLWMTPA